MEKKEKPDFNKPPRDSHSDHADQLMEHAEAMLAEGDRLQATEKAFGAYAHQMKVLANQKGWKYDKNSDLFKLKDQVDDLAQKKLGTKRGEVRRLILAAPHNLHYNFYKDEAPLSDIRMGIDDTKKIIGILRKLGGNGNGTPSGNGTSSGNGKDAGSGQFGMNTLSVSYDVGMIVLSVVIFSVIVSDSQALAAVAGIIAFGHAMHFVATLINWANARRNDG